MIHRTIKTISTLLIVSFVYFALSEIAYAGEFWTGVNDAVIWGSGAGLSSLPLFPPAASPSDPSIITNIIAFLRGLVASISVLAIIIGGFMYIISIGNDEKVARAKKIVFAAIIGLLITFIAEILRAAITSIYQGYPNAGPLKGAITNIISFVLAFTAIVAVAAFIYGGFTYITSGGNDEKTQRGKKTIIYAVVGIVVIMVSAAIVNIVITP